MKETCGSMPLLEKIGMMKDWAKNLKREGRVNDERQKRRKLTDPVRAVS
jgi:hypothetical protein